MNFGRMVTAMCTPFDSSLQIDWNRQAALIEHLIATGTDTIVVSGTTAESPTLTKEEKCRLFAFTLEKVKKRVKVIAGTGSNSTADTIALTKQAEEMGVDGVMLVAPYYNRPSQEGLYQHFAAVHNETNLPLMIYNVPGRTSVNITTETLVRLAALPGVVAIKEASGSISQISDVIRLVPKDVAVYSGDDALTLPVLALGGAGVISVASHVVGIEMKEMIDAFLSNDHQKAQVIHHTLTPVFHGLFSTTSPGPLKYALSRMKLMEEHVRLPLVTLTSEEKAIADVWIKSIL
ncbi:4-hydroxy-tetrahydrodipicolinate synthase [Thermoactinomyces sp. DSM 45892]|uniref:4-hydroxy-tetrahydrodipicolinate synthase n=1 Tax=Thermoactinomyces sp. DSM 45892 TaxID=1882753 RepID=UPI000896A8D6|nr:4-hydroxy-tetrahydrodipicolinate synthase [Thermoactinomyces sp. DSM 45892]SDY48070.1 4-hydroxy-tetrahydrodipicolinate synthase [Thermoactinomyces sp. DSM 45892]